jgi:hypothetical protein
MKKLIIGSLVGGLLIFIWQFLSFVAINFHEPFQSYTPKQDSILNFLEQIGLEEGGYYMPGLPEGSTREQHEAAMKDAEGKPWASIPYHKAWKNDMVISMVRGFLVDVIIVMLFCWIVGKMNAPSGGTIISGALAMGMIVYLNAPYTASIWYEIFDAWAFLLDAVVSWLLVGIWLAFWLRRGRNKVAAVYNQRPA